MVPLMMLTLAVVVASQIAGVGRNLGALLLAIPVYILFAAVMVPLGAAAGRVAGLDVAGRRAIVFSGATRNPLVVLPLVLALPAAGTHQYGGFQRAYPKYHSFRTDHGSCLDCSSGAGLG